MKNLDGQRVPDVTFHVHDGGDWRTLTTQDIFAKRTVVVFSLPGAFTPKCSSSHMPRYNELADELADAGVDEIVCVSVNDTYVMSAWRAEQKADRVSFLPDGNAAFTTGMGALVDKRELGYGPRSWRYSMLVKDGVIEKMFIEPDVAGDPLEVSDADTMLRYLSPALEGPRDIVLFTRPGCFHCVRARRLLDEAGLRYEEIPSSPRRLRAVTGRRTTPQVFVDGQHLGGADELEAWLGKAGKKAAEASGLRVVRALAPG